MWNIFPFSALEGTHELWLFFFFFQNLELSRWLQAVQSKLSWGEWRLMVKSLLWEDKERALIPEAIAGEEAASSTDLFIEPREGKGMNLFLQL